MSCKIIKITNPFDQAGNRGRSCERRKAFVSMQTFTIDPGSNGKSLIRVILNQYPELGISKLRQALRQKDIRVNGQRVHADCAVATGDLIAVYLADEWLCGDFCEKKQSDGKANAVLLPPSPYSIIYQDPLIILVNKKPGITVSSGNGEKSQGQSLLERAREDLHEPGLELCHRLDRLTGGLLLLSRRPAALTAVQSLMRQGLIVKRYRCLVRGIPDEGQPVVCHDGENMLELNGFLEKVARQSDVYIHDQKNPGDLPIITRYRVLRVFSGAGPDQEAVSELLVELVTGRTHQIRAHFAHIGHPLLGDGKYGRNSYNRHFRGPNGPLSRQQLCSAVLLFRSECQGPLAYLAGKTFAIQPEYDWQPMDHRF